MLTIKYGERVWSDLRVCLAEAKERTAFWDWKNLLLRRSKVGHL